MNGDKQYKEIETYEVFAIQHLSFASTYRIPS